MLGTGQGDKSTSVVPRKMFWNVMVGMIGDNREVLARLFHDFEPTFVMNIGVVLKEGSFFKQSFHVLVRLPSIEEGT